MSHDKALYKCTDTLLLLYHGKLCRCVLWPQDLVVVSRQRMLSLDRGFGLEWLSLDLGRVKTHASWKMKKMIHTNIAIL